MAENSAIEWTDHTFNPWMGCTKVGPGCDHCYAEALMDKRYGKVHWGVGQPRVRTASANWRKPLQWNVRPFYACRECGWRGETDSGCPMCAAEVHGARARVFCASLADVFDNAVDPAWRVDLFALIAATPNLDWLLLTKRIGNVGPMIVEAERSARAAGHAVTPWLHAWSCGDAPRNIWLGATVVNQEEADRDVPKLLATPARVRFLSCEPLLGPLDLTGITVKRDVGEEVFSALYFDGDREDEPELGTATLDWVIAGGESGPGARPMHPDWARGLRDQCAAAGVPFLFKQWGEWLPMQGHAQGVPVRREKFTHPDGTLMGQAGKKAAGRLLDGVQHDGYPT